MDTLSINQIISQKRETIIEVSLDSINRLSVLNANIIKPQLMNFVSNQGTTVLLNLNGLNFIDSTGFDCLNQVSRVARRHHSSLKLLNVESELIELINLVKEYAVFDIDSVIPVSREYKVA